MKNTSLAKTLTASLPGDAQTTFARISNPDNLSSWHSSFCRSLRKEEDALVVESPRGPASIRFIRDDHSLVLDLVVEAAEGVALTNAIRIIPNGEGCEFVWTLVKAEGLSDALFNEQLRWAGSALHNLRKEPLLRRAPAIESAESSPSEPSSPTLESSETLQVPSPAEMSSMPLSGKKLFIGNLSYDWTDEQLRAHFSEQGAVTLAEVARFRGRGGRSRGFGFVEMSTETEAQNAIEKLHGGTAGGRQIIVRLAKSQESRPAKASEAAPAADASSPSAEPGNEREPRASRAHTGRSRTERPRRGGSRPSRPTGNPNSSSTPYARRESTRPAAAAPRPYQEQDISNKSGYEIFPRRGPKSSVPSQTSLPSSAPPSRPSSREPSPYMDDTGDIENHGHRPPRHRRRS